MFVCTWETTSTVRLYKPLCESSFFTPPPQYFCFSLRRNFVEGKVLVMCPQPKTSQSPQWDGPSMLKLFIPQFKSPVKHKHP